MHRNNPILILVACGALAVAPRLAAQSPARPTTEADLLKTLDTLGDGDPKTRSTLSVEPRVAPAAKKDKAAKGDRSQNGETEITAEEGAFDQHSHQAIFTINVFVKNPDFTVKCDKLTAYMKHDDTKPDSKAPGGAATPRPVPVATPLPIPTGASPAPGKGAPGAGKAGGLEKAVAEGNVEIVQDKVEEDGTITHNIGHGKKAVYDAATGDVTLTGKPEVQTGINSCVALDESTVIVLNRSGHMTTKGPHKVTIKDAAAVSATPNAR